MNVVLIGVGKNFLSVPYFSKLTETLRDYYSVRYVFWDRTPSATSEGIEGIWTSPILRFDPKTKRGLAVGYLLWMLSVFRFALFKVSYDDLIFVSRFEAGFGFYLAKLIRPKLRFIYLDRDPFHLSYNLGIFRHLVKNLETRVGSAAVLHIVPGSSRNFTMKQNVRILPNSPSEKTINRARALAKERGHVERDRFVVYVNGWLVPTRGASMILEAVSRLDPNLFEVKVAGPIECPDIEKLTHLGAVTYLGQLSNTEALSHYFDSDITLCFYDPQVEVNVKAEPNKWLDCAFTGTGFITNFGIETFRPYLGIEKCFQIPYGDSAALFDLLLDLGRTRNLGDASYSAEVGVKFWDVELRAMLAEAKLLE